MQKSIDKYFAERDEGGLPYTIESLAMHLEIDRNTLLTYEKGESHKEFHDTVKKAKTKVLSNFIDSVLAGGIKTSAALPIFLLKNNFGYEDKNEIAVTNYNIEF